MKVDREPKKRGRPREFDREAALGRALELFWRRGYEATSLGELTEAMGVTPPSLYAAFGNKEGLFLEAMELYQRRYGASGVRALAEEPTARGAVGRLLLDAAGAFTMPDTPRGCFVILAATNCTAASADVEAALRDRRRAGERAIGERLARAAAEGELPCGVDVAALAKHYATVLQGMSVQARDGASRSELEAVARLAMRAWPGG